MGPASSLNPGSATPELTGPWAVTRLLGPGAAETQPCGGNCCDHLRGVRGGQNQGRMPATVLGN